MARGESALPARLGWRGIQEELPSCCPMAAAATSSPHIVGTTQTLRFWGSRLRPSPGAGSRCWLGWFLPEAPRENLFPGLSSS